jgi:regulator of protease activity HflC (stomatin/prohibitin superfamily)
VPTKDNVRVSIDIGINFHIGKSEDTEMEDAKRFFYNFGPNRLEELLMEECEEEIRDFVKQIKVSRVRDIKTELTSSMLKELQDKFNPYGIVIEQVNVMNVILPIDLRFSLMQTTTFDVFLQKQVRQQQNRMLIINNNENKQLLRLKRDNIQTLMTFQHNQDVEEINLLQSEITMKTKQTIAEIKGMKK